MSTNISILILSYNQARFLHEGIGSVLNQTVSPDEIVIVDDGSTDGSVEILKAYQEKFSKIKLILLDKNRGCIANVNHFVPTLKCSFFAICPVDDILSTYFVENTLEVIRRYPDIGIVCSDSAVFSDQKPYVYYHYKFFPPANDICIFSPKDLVTVLRDTFFLISSSTPLYNTKYFLMYGGYNEKLLSLSDYFLNYQIGLRHKVAYIPKPLGTTRIVKNSFGDKVRNDHKRRKQMFRSLIEVILKNESPEFRKDFIKSRILWFNGLFFIYFCIRNIRYWKWLPPVVIKSWKVLLKKTILKIFGKKIPFHPHKPIYVGPNISGFPSSEND